MPKRTNIFSFFAAFGCVFAAPSVFACTPPLNINHASPPPKNEQVVTSAVQDVTLAFVPYSQGERFIEYRVWAMDKACRAVEVPVEETLGNGSTRENGLVCAHFTVDGSAVQCTLSEEKTIGYHYEADGLQLDKRPASSKPRGKGMNPNSSMIHNSVIVYGNKGRGKAK